MKMQCDDVYFFRISGLFTKQFDLCYT